MKYLFLGVALTLSACATPARQTELLLHSPRDIPESAEVAGVPFIDQTDHFCGPSTLTMALHRAGKDVPLEEVATQVYTPGKQGSFQTDMVVAVRRNGMLAIPVQGMADLLREVSSGHPVIIFENLAFSWHPKWHYALVFGYDLKEEELTLHDGNRKARRWSMRKFERSWMLSDYWGFTVLPPGELAATANELTHATAGAGLEQEGKLAEAEKVYLSILKKWPDSLGALIGMGNLTYGRSDFRESVKFLTKATEAHPKSVVAWHNRANAEEALRQFSGRSGRI